jgi:NADPH:quinone reductase-like Zn-dependent oxidoreductase
VSNFRESSRIFQVIVNYLETKLILACDFNKGDEVFGLAYGGAYAEYIAVSVKMIVHKPKELSWETAAGVPEVWFTAIQALYLVGNLTKGQTVLFHAGASGVTLSRGD